MTGINPTDTQQVDRAAMFAEVRAITAVHIAMPEDAHVRERTARVTEILRGLLDDTDRRPREAVRLMHRTAIRLLGTPPDVAASLFTRWQYLIDVSRVAEALIELGSRGSR